MSRYLARTAIMSSLLVTACSSEPDPPSFAEKPECPQALVQKVARDVAWPAVERLRAETDPSQRESDCRTYARGLLGEFFYTASMMDEADRVGCDGLGTNADDYGLQLLRSVRQEAERLCSGRIEQLMASESDRIRGRRILDQLLPDERQTIESEWQSMGGTTDQ